MRNDVESHNGLRVGIIHAVDRERHAINSDRALGSNKRRDILRHANSQPVRIAHCIIRQHLTDTVDMTGNDMAAQLIADL